MMNHYLLDANGKYLVDANGKRLISVPFVAPPAVPQVWAINWDYWPAETVAYFNTDGSPANGANISLTPAYVNNALKVADQIWIACYAGGGKPDLISRRYADGTPAGSDLTGNGLSNLGQISMISTQIWGCNAGNASISRFNADGSPAGAPISGNSLAYPWVACQVAEDLVWVLNGTTGIRRFDLSGNPLGGFDTGFNQQQDIKLLNGIVWVLHTNDPRVPLSDFIRRYNPDGTSAGSDLTGNDMSTTAEMGIVADHMWVSSTGNSKISRFNPDGSVAGASLSGNGLNSPGPIVQVL